MDIVRMIEEYCKSKLLYSLASYTHFFHIHSSASNYSFWIQYYKGTGEASTTAIAKVVGL